MSAGGADVGKYSIPAQLASRRVVGMISNMLLKRGIWESFGKMYFKDMVFLFTGKPS